MSEATLNQTITICECRDPKHVPGVELALQLRLALNRQLDYVLARASADKQQWISGDDYSALQVGELARKLTHWCRVHLPSTIDTLPLHRLADCIDQVFRTFGKDQPNTRPDAKEIDRVASDAWHCQEQILAAITNTPVAQASGNPADTESSPGLEKEDMVVLDTLRMAKPVALTIEEIELKMTTQHRIRLTTKTIGKILTRLLAMHPPMVMRLGRGKSGAIITDAGVRILSTNEGAVSDLRRKTAG